MKFGDSAAYVRHSVFTAEDSGLLHLVYSCAAEKHNTAPFSSHDVPIVPRETPVID